MAFYKNFVIVSFMKSQANKRAKAKKAGIARWKKKLATMNEVTLTSSKNRKY